MNLKTTPEELFMLIGEREFIKYKQDLELKTLYGQIDEMSEIITKLRVENEALKNGKLEQPDNNDTV